MDKEQWIYEASLALIDAHSPYGPLTDKEKANFVDWAATLAEGEYSFYGSGYSPIDAVNEELSYA